MKLAIMQPYFFPYAGYFSLIKHTDKFILLDTVQFIRHGWIERNRILKQQEGWIYIKVPVIKEGGRETLIRDIKIDNSQKWKQKILAQLQPYKKIAPYFNQVFDLVTAILTVEYDNITILNKNVLEGICDFIGINHQIEVFSEIGLVIGQPQAPDEWALNICKAYGKVGEYWNPSGGRDFFHRKKYDEAGINLRFQRLNLVPYSQKKAVFEPGLSIIDVIMFNSVNETNKMLDNYELI
ncbi:MAG: WbqC family protein [Bacteroidales bacterium]|nr:WbqC family protein [Bacteroidales bacterium]